MYIVRMKGYIQWNAIANSLFPVELQTNVKPHKKKNDTYIVHVCAYAPMIDMMV